MRDDSHLRGICQDDLNNLRKRGRRVPFHGAMRRCPNSGVEKGMPISLRKASNVVTGTGPAFSWNWPSLSLLVSSEKAGNRNLAIDVGRFVAICAVVAIHSVDKSHYDGVSDASGALDAGEVIDQLSRFAVPFFFITSGYFLALKRLDHVWSVVWDIVKRISIPYLIWTLAFNLFDARSRSGVFHPVLFLPRLFLQGGAAPHLWFLPSLALCMILLVVSQRYLSLIKLLVTASVLYIVGLLVGSYAFFVFGKPAGALQLHLARDAPCFGFIFLVIGYALRRSAWRPRMRVALAIFLLGAVLQLAEGYYLSRLGFHPISENDYVLGTLSFGVGAFLVALAWPEARPLPRVLAALGTCSLGLYAVHPAFILLFTHFVDPRPLLGRLGIWTASLLCSIILVTAFDGNRWLRKLVR
jgi:surface polysaccharide O-acyltransferase-like enzyme